MSDVPRRLAAPFDPALVSFRVGPTTQDKKKGMALAYIDARDVMRRLDEVCGPENWQDDYPWSDGKRVVCRIGIKVGDEWVWKADGAGDTDTEGEKGALSDAFKRAAVKWGVARYLYDVDATWVAIEQAGKSYSIAPHEFARLRAALPKPPGASKQASAGDAVARATPPVSPEEPPEVEQSRQDMRRILGAMREAPTMTALDELWRVNTEAVAKIKKYGGDNAMLLLNDTFTKRLDALRASP